MFEFQDVGGRFSAKKRKYPPTLGNKKARRVNTPGPSYEKTARPPASPCTARERRRLASIRTHSASQIAGRRDEPPGLSLSPGAEHSSKAEIAPQQLPKALCHFDSPPFSYNTYLFDWFGSIIPQPHWVVKPFFRLFWWELGFCEKGKKSHRRKDFSLRR